MEAQPASSLLLVAARLLEGRPLLPLLLFPQSAWLACLGGLILLWWARSVETWTERRPALARWRAPARLLPLVLALGGVWGPLLPQVLTGRFLIDFFLAALLLVWLWRRALARARLGFEHEALARSFRLGFLALLASLMLALLASWRDLLAALSLTLPLFFFAGLQTLSLARLSTIRRQRLRRAGGTGAVADPTRPWLLALFLLSLLILLLVALLETIFSFVTFQSAITLLTPILARAWDWISEALLWLIVLILTPFFDLFALVVAAVRQGGPASAPVLISPATLRRQLLTQQGQSHLSVPPLLLMAGRLLLLLLIIGALLWLVLRVVHLGHWRPLIPEVEEEREMLNPLALLGERLRQRRRQRRRQALIEPLAPTSLRWLYRAWLQEVAARDRTWARCPAETPQEYLARLRASLQATGNVSEDKAAVSAQQLVEFGGQLTQAYLPERYGGRPAEAGRLAALQQYWKKLHASLSTRGSRFDARQKSEGSP